MIKRNEINDPDSCLNKAADDEPVFVLRGHDVAAPETIRFWVQERIRLEKNEPNDQQITEALAMANYMEKWRND